MQANLPRWSGARARISGFVGNPLIIFVGDSLTLRSVGAAEFYPRIEWHQNAGERLHGVSFIEGGNNGVSLSGWLGGSGTYTLSQCIADAQAAITAGRRVVVVLRFGINDVRTGTSNQAALQADLISAVTTIQAGAPGADLVLHGPNAFLSDDPYGAGTVVPIASAQAYSDAMFGAFEAMRGRWANVEVIQKQAVTGALALPSAEWGPTNPGQYGCMTDPVHTNSWGQDNDADQIADFLGWREPVDRSLAISALRAMPSAPWLVYPRVVELTEAYRLIGTGRWNGQSFNSLTFRPDGVLQTAAQIAAAMAAGDLVQLGCGGPVWQMPSNAGFTTNGPLFVWILSAPPAVMTGGTVNVFRRI